MTFDEVWASAAIGAIVGVSDGRAAPPGGLGSMRYNLWRSHNFAGELLEKVESGPRVLRISDLGNPGAVVYDVSEAVAHTFEIVN